MQENFPAEAANVANVLRQAITAGTERKYCSAYKSYQDYCIHHGEPPVPAKPQVLAFWLVAICPSRIRSSSCSKYLSAVRSQHIAQGLDWWQRDAPVVQQTLAGLLRAYPSHKPFKVALTLALQLKMCEQMHGWPRLDQLSYDDLLWATASSFGWHLALRGGEFFTYPGSNRPVLLDSYVSFRFEPAGLNIAVPGHRGRPVLMVQVPLPKTQQGAAFTLKVAVCASLPPASSQARWTGTRSRLDPYMLWSEYRRRRDAAIPVDVRKPRPAFLMRDGSPLSRNFMVSRAAALLHRAGIICTDPAGRPIVVVAASWRAGQVVSSIDAGFDEAYIKAAGQWTSTAWTAYAQLPLATLTRSADRLALLAHQAVCPSSYSAVGWTSSSDPLERRYSRGALTQA